MSKSADPPSDERKTVDVWKKVRRMIGVLVNQRTLKTAFHVLLWIMRIIKLLKQLFGDL